MRTAYFGIEFPPRIFGGLGVYLDAISRQLVDMGESISVFTLDYGDLPSRETIDGVKVFREFPTPIDGLEIFLSPETLAWGDGLRFLLDLFSYNQLALGDLFREGPFQLVVAHDWLSLPAGLAAKSKGIPLIYHVHCLEVGRSERPNPQLVALERRGAAKADLVITVSEAMKGDLASMGVPAEKVRVCHHGVDAEFFDPGCVESEALEALREKYGYAKDDVIVVFIGRLEPVKGVRELFSAMPQVLAEHEQVKLLVIGKGSLEEWSKVELQRQSNIRLVTDFLDAEEKRLHYALADLCVFPSLYEPFGIVALEAAAMGKASVVGAAGTSGLREIVENPATEKPTGVHVDARDPKDLAWGINLALADPKRMKIWGRNARERAISEFSWQKAAVRSLKIYQEATSTVRGVD